MLVKEIVAKLNLKVAAGQEYLETEITGGFAADLLSNVMGQAEAGNIWVTMQGHQNIIAVASLAGLSAIIIAGGAEPEEEAITKALRQKVILLTTGMSSFEVVGRLYSLGIAGKI